MDAVAAITDRIAGIRGTIAGLGSTAAATPPSGRSFDSILATEIASRSGPGRVGTRGVSVNPSVQRVGAYGPEQLANAAAIIAAGKAMGLSVRDQTIGVMTAMGESSLRVVDHGDAAGPDSRGLFQQRANGAWGSASDRMDPTTSATSFFTALTRVGGRDAMTPTAVAHAVQRNADPNHYARYWDDAVAVVTTLTGSRG